VFNDLNTTASQLINVGLNNLFGEITWFYCTESSTVINRCVTYNYQDSRPQRPVWTTGTLARGTWQDSSVFGLPHATEYDASSNASYDVVGNTDGCTIYFEHEQGTNEFIMKIRRFVPDFLSQTGNTQVTLQLRNYPNDSRASSSLGPFTISSSTTKVDTRARARAISLKIANTAVSQSWKLGTFRLDVQPDGRR
jgi:hypothetical protein